MSDSATRTNNKKTAPGSDPQTSCSELPILQISHLCCSEILHDISLNVQKGEMLAIMGPSGSGKSTLLYQAAGIDQPDQGEIRIDGDLITDMKEKQTSAIRLQKLGFIFQSMNMAGSLSLIDNIQLPALQFCHPKSRTKKKEIRDKALSLMEHFGLAGMENRSIREVSGGQLQRACICRALINDPQILFADEPTGALNQKAAEDVMRILKSLNKKGQSILIVTHDPKIASCCTRILYLLDGRIISEFSAQKPGDPEKNEKAVRQWLADLGW